MNLQEMKSHMKKFDRALNGAAFDMIEATQEVAFLRRFVPVEFEAEAHHILTDIQTLRNKLAEWEAKQ